MALPLWLAALVLAGAHVRAVGIVWSADPGHRVAILACGGASRVVGIGETACGGIVREIQPAAVLLQVGEDRVPVPLAGDVAAATAPSAPPPAASAPGPEPGADAEAPPVELSRQEVDRRLLEEVPRILAEARLVPFREGGRVVGFTLTRLPAGTLLDEVGLRTGDVLTQINDVSLDSLATLASLWPRLREAKRLRAVVLRGGVPVVLEVRLR